MTQYFCRYIHPAIYKKRYFSYSLQGFSCFFPVFHWDLFYLTYCMDFMGYYEIIIFLCSICECTVMYHQMKDEKKNKLMNKIFIMNHGGGYLICCTWKNCIIWNGKLNYFTVWKIYIISASDAAVYWDFRKLKWIQFKKYSNFFCYIFESSCSFN